MDDDTLAAWAFQNELDERRWEYEGLALQPEFDDEFHEVR